MLVKCENVMYLRIFGCQEENSIETEVKTGADNKTSVGSQNEGILTGAGILIKELFLDTYQLIIVF